MQAEKERDELALQLEDARQDMDQVCANLNAWQQALLWCS